MKSVLVFSSFFALARSEPSLRGTAFQTDASGTRRIDLGTSNGQINNIFFSSRRTQTQEFVTPVEKQDRAPSATGPEAATTAAASPAEGLANAVSPVSLVSS
jgi:hypothetical protein